MTFQRRKASMTFGYKWRPTKYIPRTSAGCRSTKERSPESTLRGGDWSRDVES